MRCFLLNEFVMVTWYLYLLQHSTHTTFFQHAYCVAFNNNEKAQPIKQPNKLTNKTEQKGERKKKPKTFDFNFSIVNIGHQKKVTIIKTEHHQLIIIRTMLDGTFPTWFWYSWLFVGWDNNWQLSQQHVLFCYGLYTVASWNESYEHQLSLTLVKVTACFCNTTN